MVLMFNLISSLCYSPLLCANASIGFWIASKLLCFNLLYYVPINFNQLLLVIIFQNWHFNQLTLQTSTYTQTLLPFFVIIKMVNNLALKHHPIIRTFTKDNIAHVTVTRKELEDVLYDAQRLQAGPYAFTFRADHQKPSSTRQLCWAVPAHLSQFLQVNGPLF